MLPHTTMSEWDLGNRSLIQTHCGIFTHFLRALVLLAANAVMPLFPLLVPPFSYIIPKGNSSIEILKLGGHRVKLIPLI